MGAVEVDGCRELVSRGLDSREIGSRELDGLEGDGVERLVDPLGELVGVTAGSDAPGVETAAVETGAWGTAACPPRVLTMRARMITSATAAAAMTRRRRTQYV